MPFSPSNLPQLVIFDNDGVLIDSEHLAAAATAQALNEAGYDITVDEVRHSFVGLSFQAMRKKLAERGISPSAALDNRIEEIFQDKSVKELTAIAGAIDLVQALKDADIPVCVCSNAGEDWLVNSHKNVGLSAVFSPLHYFHRDCVANPKPAPDMHLLALDSFGIAPSKALVIEDSPIGASGGIAAGVTVWGFTGATGTPVEQKNELLNLGASKVFETLLELRQYLLGS